jgi:hypothetical protein
MPMGDLLSLITIIYFVAIILAVYHLQQQELDRIQRQIDKNNRLVDECSGAFTSSRHSLEAYASSFFDTLNFMSQDGPEKCRLLRSDISFTA